MGTIARGSLAAILAAVLVVACGGGGGGGGSSPPNPSLGATAANEMTVTVDRGPTVAGNVNQPFVSVTVCLPGSTTDCQTIDHVLVDTGSTGLRLVADVVSPALLAGMPARQDGSGNDLLECQAFVLGYTWGSVRLADVKLGDLTAGNLAIHVIGDPAAPVVPADCSSRGSGIAMNDLASLGAKGILGIDTFIEDCPGCAQQSTYPVYFTCPGGTCGTVQVALADQIRNPVVALPSDNNGILLAMPAVPATGATNVTGALIFGVGTRSNNALGSATVFDLDQYGELRTWYKNAGYWSFLDSGSNGLFFPDATIAQCAGGLAGFYCPLSTLSLQAEIAGATTANWTVYNFEVANAASLPANTAYRNLAGPWPGAFSYFDWGMPFFYGRRVSFAIDGRSTPAGNGPYVAF